MPRFSCTRSHTIVDELKDKHGQKYSDVQYIWCTLTSTVLLTHHLISLFLGKKNLQVLHLVRGYPLGQCIDQLDKWSKLMERGVISDTEYEELQEKILKDIKNF